VYKNARGRAQRRAVVAGAELPTLRRRCGARR